MQPHSAKRAVISLIALILACFAVFAIWPGIDLRVSRWFFTPGAGFMLDRTPVSEAIRNGIWNLSTAMVGGSVALLVWGLATRRPVLAISLRIWAYILALYALSPGLLVNGILKQHWGRARPADVTEFGGLLRFTPPHVISDQCTTNCSFVSGEMAASVALAIALLVVLNHRRTTLSPLAVRIGQGVALALPLVCGVQRIVTGRHFLSDILLATLFTVTLAVALSPILPRRR